MRTQLVTVAGVLPVVVHMVDRVGEEEGAREVVMEVGNADISEQEGDNCDQSNMSHLCDRHHLCDRDHLCNSKNHYRT